MLPVLARPHLVPYFRAERVGKSQIPTAGRRCELQLRVSGRGAPTYEVKAPLATNERERLEALRSFEILDSESEAAFEDLVEVASHVCGTPIALISLVDEERQWFKARVGLEFAETPRDQAFCAHAILDDATMIVPDATRDERFRENPLVTEAPGIRFYAGAPLRTTDGYRLGTLCVFDTEAREANPLSAAQVEVLEALSRQVVRLLELRRVSAHLVEELSRSANLVDQVKQGSNELKTIFNATADGLITIDETGTILTFNRSAESLFGYQRAEIVGQNVKMLAPSPYHEEHDGYLRRYVNTGNPHVIGVERELLGKRKDGSSFPMALRVTETRIRAERVFIGTVQDISERKRAQEELQALNTFAISLLQQSTVDDFLWTAARSIGELLGFEDCVIYLLEGGNLVQAATYGTKNPRGRDIKNPIVIPLGSGIVGTVAKTGIAETVPDTEKDARYIFDEFSGSSELAVPIIYQGAVLGVLDSESSIPDRYTTADLDKFQLIANITASRIASALEERDRRRAEDALREAKAELERRVEERTEALSGVVSNLEAEVEERIQTERALSQAITDRRQAELESLAAREQEVSIGATIQEMFLRGEPPRATPGLSIGYLSRPSQRLDGDFVDFLVHRNQMVEVVLGDVMGKGIPAALLGAATKIQFARTFTRLMTMSEGQIPSPVEVVTDVHRAVSPQLAGLESFVTVCYARFDLQARIMEFVDCGHPKMLHYHARTGLCDFLAGENPPLGFVAEHLYEQRSVPFETDDLFVMYSDGVTEARDRNGEMFGLERLSEVVISMRDQGPLEIIEMIEQRVREFSGQEIYEDDLSVVVLRIAAPVQSQPYDRHEVTVTPTMGALETARNFISDSIPSTLPLPDEFVTELQRALQEVLTNIVRHASPEAGAPLTIIVRTLNDRVAVQILYQGKFYRPERVAALPDVTDYPEGGFGLYLIEQAVDSVAYAKHLDGRNCVHLVKMF